MGPFLRIDAVELRFWLGIVGLSVVYSLLVLWLWAVVPSVLLGGHSVVVTSGSMGPVIQTGDLLVLRPHDGRLLDPGAVVTFEDPTGRGLVTHRITQVNEDGTYVTRGDANRDADAAALPPERIVGNATLLIPLIGLPTVWMGEGQLLLVAAWLAGLVLAAWTARYALLARHNPWDGSRRRGPAGPRVSIGYRWSSRPRRVAPVLSWSVALSELRPAMGGPGVAQAAPALADHRSAPGAPRAAVAAAALR